MATMHVPEVESQPDSPPPWKKQLSEAIGIPFPVRLLEQSDTDLSSRFYASYDQLRSLPRRTRRALQRQLASSTAAHDLPHKHHSNKTNRSLRHKLAWSLAGAALLLTLDQSVQAATITVTTKKADINIADGLCSLSEAIINANDDAATHSDCATGSGADVIQLLKGTHSITTAHGPYALPTITSQITIEGNGAKILRSNKAAPVAVIGTSVSGDLTLNNLTLSGGNSENSGGGIVNYGTLTLNYTTVSKNKAAVYGGGIANGGTLTVLNSKVERNKASYGGGIADNGGVTTVQDSTVSNNTGGVRGGGVYGTAYTGSDITVTNSTITGNKLQGTTPYVTGARGGAGAAIGNGAILTVENSIISKNKSSSTSNDGSGGGVLNWYGTLVTNNSTITGNTGCRGGGVFIWTATTTINNSTISKNTAKCLVNAAAESGGGVNNGRGVLTITNSTISSNKSAYQAGGIRNWRAATLTINNSTITKNQAKFGGGIMNLFEDTSILTR